MSSIHLYCKIDELAVGDGEEEGERDGLKDTELDGLALAEGLWEAEGDKLTELDGLADADGLCEADGDREADELGLKDIDEEGETELDGLTEADGEDPADWTSNDTYFFALLAVTVQVASLFPDALIWVV